MSRYGDGMSEFNYTKCSKPFTSQDEAREFMVSRGFGGSVLARADGTFTAVCPTYPDGYYPDAVVVETVAEAAPAAATAAEIVEDDVEGCCAA